MIIGISGKKQSGKDTIGKIIQWLTAIMENNEKLNEAYLNHMIFGQQEYKIKDSSWQIKKWAGKVKEILSILTGIPIEDFEKEEIKSSYLGEEWNRWKVIPNPDYNLFDGNCQLEEWFFDTKENALKYIKQYEIVNTLDIILEKITIRQALQMIGTDLFRDKFHPNTWVNASMNEYDNYFHATKFSVRQGFCKPEWPNWIITDTRFPNEAQAIKDRGGILIRIMRYGDSNEEVNFHKSEISLDGYDKFDYIIDNKGTIEELIDKVSEILKERNLI